MTIFFMTTVIKKFVRRLIIGNFTNGPSCAISFAYRKLREILVHGNSAMRWEKKTFNLLLGLTISLAAVLYRCCNWFHGISPILWKVATMPTYSEWEKNLIVTEVIRAVAITVRLAGDLRNDWWIVLFLCRSLSSHITMNRIKYKVSHIHFIYNNNENTIDNKELNFHSLLKAFHNLSSDDAP